MLVSLSVANFRSFADEQTFSLKANTRMAGAHEDHEFPIPDSDDMVLRAGVIYGPNGAGKSNLFESLKYIQTITHSPGEQTCGTGRNSFRFANLSGQPSILALQLIAGDKLYHYRVSLDDQCIIAEQLDRVVKRQHFPIYERRTDRAGAAKTIAPGLKEENERLRALLTVGGKRSLSFLSMVRTVLDRQYWGGALTDVIQWFDGVLHFIGGGSTLPLLSVRLFANEQFREFASDFLRAADTGVDYLTIEQKELSRAAVKYLLSSGDVLLTKLAEPGVSVVAIVDGVAVCVQREGNDDRFYQLKILAMHKGRLQECALPFAEESVGTQRLLELMPALYESRSGGAVYCIDEIDRSLHPLLVAKLLGYFLGTHAGVPHQLIATAHQTHLMDQALLRREEIWFAEKNSAGATELVPLVRFNPRKDLQIGKAYLEGRFGGRPRLAGVDRLIRTK